MGLSFLKMHGLGNDFAIFDARFAPLSLSVETIQAMGHRQRGIGFDQMVIIDKSEDCDAYLRIYNDDGREVSCGNATRCVAWYLMGETRKDSLILKTKFNSLKAWMKNGKISVDMGRVALEWDKIPLATPEDTLSLPLSFPPLVNPVAVNVGNPHAVFFVEDVMRVPLEKLGTLIEHHPLFPEQVNVECAEVLSRHAIRMRVWERGVGITQACGTGACAVAVAGVRRGLTERNVTLHLDGGDLEIEWQDSNGHVIMTGDVALVYRGEWLL